MKSLVSKYLKDINNTDSFNYLKDLYYSVTYNQNLSNDEAIALQRYIEYKLYLIKKDLFVDAYEEMAKIF